MFRLQLVTDPRWVNVVEGNLPEILTDHAWCEQKAASNAISLIVGYPGYSEMVDKLSEIAREELEHFRQVHEIILKRGWVLGPERKDDYVNELYKFIRKGTGKKAYLVDRLLFAAMIEARSCERFRVLSENIQDSELAEFYRDLMVSEASHYTVFLGFAREYGEETEVEQRWEEWLAYEAEVISRYGKSERVHG
jgi:tRNA-(ms[2]io[6]A)-hydroxylase